jgi:hypothetical protein
MQINSAAVIAVGERDAGGIKAKHGKSLINKARKIVMPNKWGWAGRNIKAMKRTRAKSK